MRRLLLVLVTVLLLSVGLAGATRATPTAKTDGVPQFGNVFVIIGENTDYSALTKKNAPYLLGTIKPESAWLTNYWATTHYSEANYVAMTSGQFTPCEQKDGQISSCHQPAGQDNLFHQLDETYPGTTPWQSWMESMPAPCYVSSFGSDAGLNKYRAKHNPALIFDNVAGSWNGTTFNPSSECLNQDISTGETASGVGPNDMSVFNKALQDNTVSRFNFIVPNECEDAHDNCKPVGNPVLQFDQFLNREIPLIQNSAAYQANSNGVIIVTFDEGTTKSPNHADKFGQGGQVAFAVISPLANIGSYGNMWDHYSFLRTLQDGLGTSGLGYLGGAGASGESSINTIWK
jgi:phosphatidylinositol-3-phosphatase